MLFPNEIFTKILVYCDDRVEKRQKGLLASCLGDVMSRVENEWGEYLGYLVDIEDSNRHWNYKLNLDPPDSSDVPDYGDVSITWWRGVGGLIPLINIYD